MLSMALGFILQGIAKIAPLSIFVSTSWRMDDLSKGLQGSKSRKDIDRAFLLYAVFGGLARQKSVGLSWTF